MDFCGKLWGNPGGNGIKKGKLFALNFSCVKVNRFYLGFPQPIKACKLYETRVLLHFPHFPQPLLLLDLFKAISGYKDLAIEQRGNQNFLNLYF